MTCRRYLYRAAPAILIGLGLSPVHAVTQIDPTDRYTWGANIGWLNWQGDVTNGAGFGPKFAYGNTYGANVGWINLGDGTPVNGTSYANNSAADFGINVDALSDPGNFLLSGYAYGANIGWINFNYDGTWGPAANRPRIDKATGVFQGYAYGANVGWLPLNSDPTSRLKTTLFNDAILITHTIPAQIPQLHAVPVTITMQNTGMKPWAVAGLRTPARSLRRIPSRSPRR